MSDIYTADELRNSRVIKKLLPGESGTKELKAYHGDELIAVRYRKLADGRTIRTVELVDYTSGASRGRKRK